MYRSRPSDFRLPFETLPARRQKKLRLPNGSVVVMTPCAVEIAGGSVGGKVLKVREPVRRDRVVTILPSGKVGRELVKKRAPPCGNQLRDDLHAIDATPDASLNCGEVAR